MINNDWITLKDRGNQEFTRKKYSSAINFYTEAIALNEHEDVLYANRATCQKALGKYKQAIQDYKNALQINPRNVKNIKRLAGVYILTGNYGEAEILLQKCVNLEPRDPSHAAELNEVQAKSKEVERCYDYKTREEWQKVEEICEKLLKMSPAFTLLKELYVEALLNNVKLKEAIEFLTTKVTPEDKSFTDNFDYLLALGLYYEGKYDKAKKILTVILQSSSDNEKFTRLWKLLKDIAQLKEKANELFKSGKYSEAIEEYKKLVELDPQNKNLNSIIYTNRALCFQRQNQLIDALKDANKAVSLNPNYIKAYTRRGTIYMGLYLFEEAKYDFQKAKELEPNNSEAQKLLEDAQKEEKKAKKRDYYKILDLKPGATPEEIKKAYRKMALKWHPDRNAESEETKTIAKKKFIDINDAYKVLSDPKNKQMYDSGIDPLNPEQAQMGEGPNGSNTMNFQGDPREIFKVFFGSPDGANMFFTTSGGPSGFQEGQGGFPGGINFEDFDNGGGFSQFFTQGGPFGRRAGQDGTGQDRKKQKQGTEGQNPFSFFFNKN